MSLLDDATSVITSPLAAIGQIVSSAANPFGTVGGDKWNLTRASFAVGGKTCTFYVETPKSESKSKRTGLEQLQDSGGRRKVQYKYAYRDGVALGDLGGEAGTHVFTLRFFGADYQTLFQEFIDTVTKSRESGTLTHPVLGVIFCGFEKYEFVHRHDEFNAVTINATFTEDNSQALENANALASNKNSSLRSALQLLSDAQSTIYSGIFAVSALLLLPNAIKNNLLSRLTSITGSLSRLLGQLAATFGSDAQTAALAQQVAQAGGPQFLTSGLVAASGDTTVSSGTSNSGVAQALPPVFQVGFDNATVAQISNQAANFTASNQITVAEAVYSMNQIRAQVAEAISYAETNLSVDGSDIVLSYRQLVVQFQESLEALIESYDAAVKPYVVPFPMSLRNVAFQNGLTPDRQEDIMSLNPEIETVNLVPRGTMLMVPTS